MNRRRYLGLLAAIVVAYALNFLLPVAWIAFLPALPLLVFSKKYALFFGFLIGLLVPLSLYLVYPISLIGELSVVMGEITGIPSILAILIFPLFYAIIMGLSGLFWTGFAENRQISKWLGLQQVKEQTKPEESIKKKDVPTASTT